MQEGSGWEDNIGRPQSLPSDIGYGQLFDITPINLQSQALSIVAAYPRVAGRASQRERVKRQSFKLFVRVI